MKFISLDSMVFIYLFEVHDTLHTQAENILLEVEKGSFGAITSVVAPIEALSVAKLQHAVKERDEIVHFFHETANLSVLPVDWLIAQTAADLRRSHRGLRTPDAIQLATAIEKKADVFVTNDKKLLNLTRPPLPIATMSKFLLSLPSMQ